MEIIDGIEVVTEIVDNPEEQKATNSNPIFVDRDKYVGGSEFAAVLGESKYKTRDDIMERKLSGVYGDYIRACSFGILLEDAHRKVVEWVSGVDPIVVPKGRLAPDCPYIRYNADGLGTKDGKKVLYEFKTPYIRQVKPS